LLDVTNLSAGYGDVTILRDINLSVVEGSIVAIVGANGAGKTTLLRAISGLLRPHSGRIQFRGEDITGKVPHSLVHLGLVHVPENRALFGRMTVMENLELGAYTSAARRLFKETLDGVFDLFPVLAERQGQTAATLSGGQQQMLAIGRGLMARPGLLILDEASLGLAPIVVESIFEAIDKIRRRGTTILLVEQDVKHALEVSDRAYVIENGRIVHARASAELLRTDVVQRAYLGALDTLPKES
jgi:branched-chain amino acid transport system ATP-binding protein